MNTSPEFKVLWALDAFDDLPIVRETAAKIFQSFARGTRIVVDPTYVLSPVELGVPLEFSGPWTETYLPAARKALAQKLECVSIPGLREPLVLVQSRPSLQGSVETLVSHATSCGYDLVVVGSHSRSGLKRMVMGSFAEELLLRSKVPVLIVGSQAEGWRDKNRKILVPSDLSDPRSPILSDALDLAQRLQATVTLLHVLPSPVEPVVQSGVYLLGGGWVPTPIYLEKERTRQKQNAEKFIAQATERGIPCELILDDRASSVVESILEKAREKQVSLIAMAAQSGPIASAILGSITRQVARSAPCPVVVLRTK